MKVAKALVMFFMRLLALLPLRVHYVLARLVSWLAEKVIRYRVSDVMINLGRSFPEKDYSEIKSIKHKFYRHFGNLFAETIWFGGSSERRLRRQHIVEFKGLDELARLYEAAPSVMVLMSHAGNWELYGGFESYQEDPVLFTPDKVCIVYLQQSSRMWDEIMRHNRLAPMKDPDSFEGYLEAKKVLRYALEHRGEKKVYNFIIDQYPYFAQKNPMHVRFMNQDTVTMTGAADLACKLGMAVCYLSVKEEKQGLYSYQYIPVCEDASTMSSAEVMTRYYALLEEDLRAQPWNYLWSHRRWKQL